MPYAQIWVGQHDKISAVSSISKWKTCSLHNTRLSLWILCPQYDDLSTDPIHLDVFISKLHAVYHNLLVSFPDVGKLPPT